MPSVLTGTVHTFYDSLSSSVYTRARLQVTEPLGQVEVVGGGKGITVICYQYEAVWQV